MEGGQFRRCRFAAVTLLLICGVLAAGWMAPTGWAGSPAEDQYGSALPGHGGGSGTAGQDGGNGGGSAPEPLEELNQRLNSMKKGDLLRFPGDVTVRALGSAPGKPNRSEQRNRRFRLGVADQPPRTIAGVAPAGHATAVASIRSAHRLGTEGDNDSWPLGWVLLLVITPVALAGGGAFLAHRRRVAARTARG